MGMDKTYGDSTALAFIGYGVTAVLMGIYNSNPDSFELDSMVLSLALMSAGVGQVIAGFMAFLRGDTFCTTTFTSYGLYWISTGLMHIIPDVTNRPETSDAFLGWFNFIWFVVTAFFTVGTLKGCKALQLAFVSMGIMFLLFAIGFWSDTKAGRQAAGGFGILSGTAGLYFGLATVLNNEHKTIIFPVGAPTWDPSGTGSGRPYENIPN